MKIVVAFLFTMLAFAGCADEPPEPEVDDPDAVLNDPDQYYADHFCVQNNVEPRVLAPDANGFPWQIGDWWEYSLNVNGENLGKTKLTYYDDQDFNNGVPQHYMVGTPTREEALRHAIFGENPVIGRVHRLLYSPHESGSHADMFNFPLCEGNTWTTNFYGRTFNMKVAENGGTYTIRGTASDGSTSLHTFDPEVKWFTKIHVDRNDGFTVRMDLTQTGENGNTKAYFLRGQQDEVLDMSANSPISIARDNGKEGAYNTIGALLDFARDGNNRVELHLRNPSGQSLACVGVSGGPLSGGATDCDAPGAIFEVPFTQGTWELDVVQSGLPSNVSGESVVVSIYDRSG